MHFEHTIVEHRRLESEKISKICISAQVPTSIKGGDWRLSMNYQAESGDQRVMVGIEPNQEQFDAEHFERGDDYPPREILSSFSVSESDKTVDYEFVIRESGDYQFNLTYAPPDESDDDKISREIIVEKVFIDVPMYE
jgi:hypothetical protein